MQCVLLLVWVALAAGQRIFRYDGSVVDQSDSQPVFTSSQPVQPLVIQRPTSMIQAPIFMDPQQVFIPSLPSLPNVLQQSIPPVTLQRQSILLDPQQVLSPRQPLMSFQPESNLVVPEQPPVDRLAVLVSQPQPQPPPTSRPSPEVFVSFRPQPSVFLEPTVLQTGQSDDIALVQPQQSANLPFFLPPQPIQPEVMAILPPQPSILPRQPASSIVFFPQPVMGSNFANPAALSVPVQAECDSLTRPLVDQVVGRESWHFSWCHQPDTTFTWRQAHDYCSSLGRGFLPVSIENQLKDSYVTAVMSAHRKTSIWTSGNRLRTALWSWSTGVSSQYTNWSNTGKMGLPQPDNAEGNEFCLAVRYSYSDGGRWHDETCTSSSLVICQSNGFV